MELVLAAGAVEGADLTRFWAALAALLVTARLMGMLARRYGQPAVVGELSAGILLGPTLLGRVLPDVEAWLFTGDVPAVMVAAVAWLGVVLLLAMTGFETDLGMLRRLGRAAGLTSIASLVVPFAAGLGLAVVLPDSFVGAEGPAFVLFIGVALSISALPVVAKVLREMGMVSGAIGQITLAAGMVNDLVGWLLLGLVAGLARTGSVDPAALSLTVLGVVAFLAVAASVGQRAVDGLMRAAAIRDNSSVTIVGAALCVVLVAGAVTQALGVEAVLGAFVAGILLSRSPVGGRRVEHQLSSVTDGVLAPVFFASAGLQVDLLAVVAPSTIGWTLAVIAVATVGKVGGGMLGARLGGLPTGQSLAIGIGLNARGALEIVVASIGLGLGVLTDVAYSVVVVMAVATSMLAPPALGFVLRRLGGEEEGGEVAPSSPVLTWRHALLPTRGGDSSTHAGMLLDRVLQPEARITALTVHPPELPATRGRDAARQVTRHVLRRMTWRERTGEAAATAILEEARLGYDVIAVGASAEDPDQVVSAALADLLLAAPTPVLIHRVGTDARVPQPVRRVIATVDGSTACDLARDVAARIAASHEVELDLVHVLPVSDLSRDARTPVDGGRRAADRVEVVGRAATGRASELGADAALVVRTGTDVPAAVEADLVDAADLVVIGTEVRSAGGEAVLGRTAEEMLLRSTGSVLVVALPPAIRGLG